MAVRVGEVLVKPTIAEARLELGPPTQEEVGVAVEKFQPLPVEATAAMEVPALSSLRTPALIQPSPALAVV